MAEVKLLLGGEGSSDGHALLLATGEHDRTRSIS
jgi:hypothetical protein